MKLRKATDDGYATMTHYNRRGPICETRFAAGMGYFWKHINATREHGPFATRAAAVQDESSYPNSTKYVTARLSFEQAAQLATNIVATISKPASAPINDQHDADRAARKDALKED